MCKCIQCTFVIPYFAALAILNWDELNGRSKGAPVSLAPLETYDIFHDKIQIVVHSSCVVSFDFESTSLLSE